jgi:hypothetical protein
MEEPGEQCTVVFALIVTELASECVYVEGVGELHRSPPLAGSVKIYAKTTVHCSPSPSMLTKKQLSEVEGKPYTSSLNICPEAGVSVKKLSQLS